MSKLLTRDDLDTIQRYLDTGKAAKGWAWDRDMVPLIQQARLALDALEVLREVEWVGGADEDECPLCRKYWRYGHALDCKLAALLAQQHSCSNCSGIDPGSCMFNQQAKGKGE